jgi:hypothetical protein
VDGDWNREEFLVLSPGECIEATDDESLMKVGRAPDPLGSMTSLPDA